MVYHRVIEEEVNPEEGKKVEEGMEVIQEMMKEQMKRRLNEETA